MLRQLRFLFFLGLVLLGLKAELKAQADSSISNYTLIFDGGGLGGYWTATLERSLIRKNQLNLYVALGVGVHRIKDFDGEFNPSFSIPASIGATYGRASHQLEFSISNTYVNFIRWNREVSGDRTKMLNGSGQLGYRYNPISNDLFVRVFYSGVLVNYKHYQSWGGLGLGYTF